MADGFGGIDIAEQLSTPGPVEDSETPETPRISPTLTKYESFWGSPDLYSGPKTDEDASTEITSPSSSRSVSTQRKVQDKDEEILASGSIDVRGGEEARSTGESTFTIPPECTINSDGTIHLHPYWSRQAQSCLQCSIKGMKCNQDDFDSWTPSCTRCIRNNIEEMCLAKRRTMTLGLSKDQDLTLEEQDRNRGSVVEWPNTTQEDNLFLIIRLPSDTKDLWAKKLALADDLQAEAQTNADKANWICPYADGKRSGSTLVRNSLGRAAWEKRAFEASTFEKIKEAGGNCGVDVSEWVSGLSEQNTCNAACEE